MTATSQRQRKLGVALLVLGFALPLFTATLIAQTASDVSKLTIRVTGARNAKGKIGVALFRDANGFPGDSSKAFRVQQTQIDEQTLSAQVIFEGVPKGTYAVSVFHDENMNGKLDKNFVGAPKEGYGASNNPKKRMGPPKFDEAKFSVDEPQNSVEIKLIY